MAHECGLSRSTVSDILNDRKGVCYGKDTIRNVRETAERLGYQTDRLASALRKGKSLSVGVMVPDLANPFYGSFLQRFMARLKTEKYSVLVEECLPIPDPDGEEKVMRNLALHRIDGLLAICTHGSNHKKYVNKLQENGTAVLVMASEAFEGLADSLDVDYSSGATRLAKTLYRFGHRKILFVRDRPWDEKYLSRVQPLLDYYSEKGLPESVFTTLDCDSNPESSYRNFKNYLSCIGSKDRPDCIVVINDYLAMGVMRASLDSGLRLPQDISVVSFDNSPVGQMLSCGLTSVGPSVQQVADRASNLILHRMANFGRKEKGKQLTFPAELYIRESLAASWRKGQSYRASPSRKTDLVGSVS